MKPKSSNPSTPASLPCHAKISSNKSIHASLGVISVVFSLAAGDATAADYTWDGGAPQDKWSSSSGKNWANDTVPAFGVNNNLIFTGTGLAAENDLTADSDFGSITFDSIAGSFTLIGNRLTLNGNVTNNSAVLQTINLAMILSSGTHTFNAAIGDLAVGGVISGGGNLEKTGANVLTLSSANSYTGNTTINAGTLALASTGSISAGSAIINVESGAILDVSAKGSWTVQGINSTTRQLLTGSGGVTGATVIGSFGSHNAGGSGVGTQAFSSSLTYSTGSIFQWDLDVLSASTEVHDQVAATSLAGSGAEFKILLGAGDSFSDTFWNTTRNWTASDLFGATNANVNLANIFSAAATTTNFTANSLEGLFSFTSTGGGTSNQLTWTAVPEPTSALAGILIGAGLLRRRRNS